MDEDGKGASKRSKAGKALPKHTRHREQLTMDCALPDTVIVHGPLLGLPVRSAEHSGSDFELVEDLVFLLVATRL